jgi:hypothetical protein
MISDIVQYRTDVIEAIKVAAPDLVEVNWYDAMFDDADLQQWSASVPCAFVAVRDVKGSAHATGEVNLDLDICVVVVTADANNREPDAEAWGFIETIFLLANNNKFGNPNAAVPTGLSMARLRLPELRQEGAAMSVVEWHAGLTIGTNQVVQDYFYRNPSTGELILDPPTDVQPGPTTIVTPPAGIDDVAVTNDFLSSLIANNP